MSIIVNNSRYTTLYLKNVKETSKAVLLSDDDITEWVPKDCLEDWPDPFCYGDTIILEDFAIEKEFV